MKQAEPARKRGRPRAFDREAALDSAMRLFWRRGFEATSIGDLTRELGINPPSLYAAFGDKEQLFREAAQRYQARMDAGTVKVLATEPTARSAVEKLLLASADGMTRPGEPGACMLVIATGACVAASPALLAELTQLRTRTRARLQTRIRQAVQEGELPAQADAEELALLYSTIIHGMSTQRVDGATRKELRAVVAAAMRAWPCSSV
jgi:AcrR family transcriptional regulator